MWPRKLQSISTLTAVNLIKFTQLAVVCAYICLYTKSFFHKIYIMVYLCDMFFTTWRILLIFQSRLIEMQNFHNLSNTNSSIESKMHATATKLNCGGLWCNSNPTTYVPLSMPWLSENRWYHIWHQYRRQTCECIVTVCSIVVHKICKIQRTVNISTSIPSVKIRLLMSPFKILDRYVYVYLKLYSHSTEIPYHMIQRVNMTAKTLMW